MSLSEIPDGLSAVLVDGLIFGIAPVSLFGELILGCSKSYWGVTGGTSLVVAQVPGP